MVSKCIEKLQNLENRSDVKFNSRMEWSTNHTVYTPRQTMCRKGDVIGADIGEITTLIDTYNGRLLQCFIAAVVFIFGSEKKLSILYYWCMKITTGNVTGER